MSDIGPEFEEIGNKQIDAILLTAMSFSACNNAMGFSPVPVYVGLLRAAATLAIMSGLPRDRFESDARQHYDKVRACDIPTNEATTLVSMLGTDDLSMFNLEEK